MTGHRISLTGCDDVTAIEVDLSDEQAEFLTEIAERLTEESSYSCQPVMTIEPKGGSR